jgi:hypothetical protein
MEGLVGMGIHRWEGRDYLAASPHLDQIEALIFSATSGETHFVQISSWFSRK